MTKKKRKRITNGPSSGLLGGRGIAYPFETRLRVVKTVTEGGASIIGAAAAFRISPTTITNWLRLYEGGGEDALVPVEPTPPRRAAATVASTTRRDAVLETRREHPEWGTRRIRDVLSRFEALGVDEHEVRRVLHEAGLIEPTRHRGPRDHPVRRFERAEPNQLLCVPENLAPRFQKF